MRFFYILFVFMASSTLWSCASIDYSPVNLAKDGSSQAHLTGGIVGQGVGGVYIEAVNKIAIDQPVPGREVIVPAGEVTVQLYYFYGAWRSRLNIKHTSLPGRHYIIEVSPNFKGEEATFTIQETTKANFEKYQCTTQKKAQKNIGWINPQKAPACK